MPVERGLRRLRPEDEVAERVGDDRPALAAHRLERVRVGSDHDLGAGADRDVRELALAGGLERLPLDAPVEGRDDDVGLRRAACTAEAIWSGLRPGGARAGPGAAANSIGAISENPTKATLRPSRSTTCGASARRRFGAGADGLHAEPLDAANGVEGRLGPVVADVVVGEVEDVDAGVAAQAGERGGRGAEVVLLREGLAAGGDGGLEVAEGDVGAARAPCRCPATGSAGRSRRSPRRARRRG